VYHHIGALRKRKILGDRDIFTFWSKTDLDIINNVIMPVENLLRIKHEQPSGDLEENHPLSFLYKRATIYEEKQNFLELMATTIKP